MNSDTENRNFASPKPLFTWDRAMMAVVAAFVVAAIFAFVGSTAWPQRGRVREGGKMGYRLFR